MHNTLYPSSAHAKVPAAGLVPRRLSHALIQAGALSLALACASGASAAERPLKSVGVTVADTANPFFVALGKGAEEAVRKIGGPAAKVTTVSAKYDLNTQVSQIETFISNKVDMILVSPIDPKALGPVLQKARDAGIVVAAVGDKSENTDFSVVSDNSSAGVEACKFIAAKLNNKGNVVIVNGPPVTAVIERIQGCKKVFAALPGIKILSDNQDAKGSRDGGLDVMSNLLTAHARIDGVFAINDPTAVGAELAIKQAGRADVKVLTAVDGAPDAVAALKDKNSLFAMSASQNPFKIASESIRIGHAMMNGKKPPSTLIQLPTPAVTKDNVASYQGWVRD